MSYTDVILQDQPRLFYDFEGLVEGKSQNFGILGSGADAKFIAGSSGLGAGPRPPAFTGFDSTNQAASFDGVRDFVDTGVQALQGLKAFTIELWVKENVRQSSERIGFVGQNDVVEFGLINPTTILIWTSAGGSVSVGWNFQPGTWHHVVATGDGKQLKIYYDGQLVTTGGNVTTNYGTSSDKVRIGGGGVFDTQGNFFNGQMDGVAVYNKALSAAQVKTHYDAGKVGIKANVKPVIGEIPAQEVKEGEELRVKVTATDDSEQRLDYRLENAPEGAVIDPLTGEFRWTPKEEQGPGEYSITVKVTDTGMPPLSATQTFKVQVKEVNQKPEVAFIPDLTVREGEGYRLW